MNWHEWTVSSEWTSKSVGSMNNKSEPRAGRKFKWGYLPQSPRNLIPVSFPTSSDAAGCKRWALQIAYSTMCAACFTCKARWPLRLARLNYPSAIHQQSYSNVTAPQRKMTWEMGMTNVDAHRTKCDSRSPLSRCSPNLHPPPPFFDDEVCLRDVYHFWFRAGGKWESAVLEA